MRKQAALLELGIPLASVAAIIVSTGTVHTFLNYIPSALIGAPDGDTALSLLPGHRMLLSGNAARGVAWSARCYSCMSIVGTITARNLHILGTLSVRDAQIDLSCLETVRDPEAIVFFCLRLRVTFLPSSRLGWKLWIFPSISAL